MVKRFALLINCIARTRLPLHEKTSRYLSSVSAEQPPDSKRPLNGIRVLDMSRILAGPYCSMMLADLGADVIKIEKPGMGDDTRAWGPPFANNDANSDSLYFMSINRNKRSVAVDIKHRKGQQIIAGLARRCDVLLENFLPGTLDKFNIGYEALRQKAPHLIYCSITGYGIDGPFRDKPGYDVIAEGEGGMIYITGPEARLSTFFMQTGEPCKIGTAMTDLATGLYAHSAIIAALFQRERQPPPKTGQRIDCNLLSTQVAQLVNVGVNYLNTGQEPRRMGTAHGSIVPYQAFRTADDQYFTIMAGNDSQFRILCRLLRIDGVADDERFKTNRMRVKNRNELIRMLQLVFTSASLDEWLERFKGSALAHGPVNNFERVFQHPQVLHNNMILKLDHSSYGEIKVMGPPAKMQCYDDADVGRKQFVHRAPPMLGEHTEQVLREELQYSVEYIRELKAENVIE